MQLVEVQREPTILNERVSSELLAYVFPTDLFKWNEASQEFLEQCHAFFPILLSIHNAANPFVRSAGNSLYGYNFLRRPNCPEVAGLPCHEAVRFNSVRLWTLCLICSSAATKASSIVG